MGKYLHKFSTQAAFEAVYNSDDYTEPWVSLITSTEQVNYNKNFKNQYFTITALTSGNITFEMPYGLPLDYFTSISYSTDGGQTWTVKNRTSFTLAVSQGDEVLFKGSANRFYFYSDARYGVDISISCNFSNCTCSIKLSGNIMSLLYGDDFREKTTFPTYYDDYSDMYLDYGYNFTGLFNGVAYTDDYHGQFCPIEDASDLVLPAKNLSYGCYANLFNGIIYMTKAPRKIDGTTLAEYCCSNMFAGTGITNAPKLPATTLANYCYNGMFRGCTSLVTAPKLPAVTLSPGCYNNMFNNCSSLNKVEALFTTTPGQDYTYNWLQGVSSTGTFIKNANASWNVTGTSGVPTNWTVTTE